MSFSTQFDEATIISFLESAGITMGWVGLGGLLMSEGGVYKRQTKIRISLTPLAEATYYSLINTLKFKKRINLIRV